ncbi:MAG: DUF547 domain-containing protein [Fibrobacteres bacterium]|nr:DUF547 domain-containing protein [Fibrobacterota bacterium]
MSSQETTPPFSVTDHTRGTPMARCRSIAFVLLLAISSLAFDHTHAGWTRVLQAHTVEAPGPSTAVRYGALKASTAQLEAYLGELSSVTASEFAKWPKKERLAFLLNAYNAFTVKLVIDHYPVKSIKDIGGFLGSPWKKKFVPLLGRTISLDDLEHVWIRPEYREPRIHFAVVCASVGCPRLQREAFRGRDLEIQLATATREFLGDRRWNRVAPKAIEASSIFKWYGSDWGDSRSLRRFLADHLALTDPYRTRFLDEDISLDFTPYDWTLNDAR